MDTAPEGPETPRLDASERLDNTVMVSQEVVWGLAGRKDVDVTVAVGDMLIDLCAVTYDPDRDKFVLHLVAEDLADALGKLAGDGSAQDQAAIGAAGKENHENGIG
jgi:hypothetical protein